MKTLNGHVLLKTEYSQKYGLKISQPFKTWQKKYESPKGALRRLLQEEIGETFPDTTSHLLCSFIKKEQFPIYRGTTSATRNHYLCELSFQPFFTKPKITFVKKENFSRIQKMTYPNRSLAGDIVLHEFDYEMLFKILEIQRVLILG